MNKAEYKKISHDIRYAAFRDARYRTEKTGKKHTTRGILHNIMWWCDSTAIDKYGKLCYTLITVKHWKIRGGYLMTKALIAKAKVTLENFLKENDEFVVNMNNGICFKHYGEHYRIMLDDGKINVFRRCFSDIHDTFIGTIDR